MTYETNDFIRIAIITLLSIEGVLLTWAACLIYQNIKTIRKMKEIRNQYQAVYAKIFKRRNKNKKALTYVLSAIQCDNPECDWVSLVPADDVILWHNRQCPKCHNCIIITDEDLKKHREDIKNKNFKKITLDLSKIFK